MPKPKNKERSKLGQLIDDRGYTLKEFAEMVYKETGYLIAVTNLSNFATGYRKIKKIEIAQHFSKTLGVELNDVL